MQHLLNKKSGDKIRVYSVDSLKGIAMMMIVITHYSWSESWRSNPIFPFMIELAVPFMMFCTGYLWAINCKEQDVYDIPRAIRKIERLLFPYAIIFFYEICKEKALGSHISFLDVVYLFIIGGNGPGSYYFPVMIQIVILFPIIFGFVSRNRMGIVVCFVFNFIYELCKNAFMISVESYRLCSLRYVFIIACGCYCYYYEKELKDAWDKAKCKVLLVSFGMILVGAGFIYFCSYNLYNPIILNYWTGTSMMTGLFVAPFAAVYIILSPRIELLEIIGKWSWGIFLIQKVYYYYYASLVYVNVNHTLKRIIINLLIIVIIGITYEKSYSYLEKIIRHEIWRVWQKMQTSNDEHRDEKGIEAEDSWYMRSGRNG